MGHQQEPIPPSRLTAYRVFFLVVRLLATGLNAYALTQANESTPVGIWVALSVGVILFAGLSIWSLYELVYKPGKLS